MPRSYQRGPHIVRRGRVWYARGGELGKDGESLHTEDRTEAERRFKALLGRERHGGPRGAVPAPRLSLVELVAAWLRAPLGYTRRTRQTHEERAGAVVRWLRDHGVERSEHITPGVVDQWITERAAGVSRATINRDLRSFRVCLRWCAERGHCEPVKALDRPGLREPTREPHRLLPDPAEVSRALEAIPSRGYRDALVIYYATGLRYEELQRVAVGDLRDGRLHVAPEAGPAATAEPGKGHRERAVPVGESVRAVIVRHLAWRTKRRGRTASKTALHRALKTACAAVSVPRFGLHDLRRCFTTEAVRRGTPLTVVRDWLGHRLTSTTERYVGRYRSDAAIEAPAVALAAGLLGAAESLPNPGAAFGTIGRQRAARKSTKRGG